MRQQVGKPCPRCGGSMLPERDTYGETLTCLQCAHSVDMVGGKVIQPVSREQIGYARPRRNSYRP